mgnify:CR=1 FL=1
MAKGVEVEKMDAQVLGQFYNETDKMMLIIESKAFTHFTELYFVNDGKSRICLHSMSMNNPHNRERSYSIQTVNDTLH